MGVLGGDPGEEVGGVVQALVRPPNREIDFDFDFDCVCVACERAKLREREREPLCG